MIQELHAGDRQIPASGWNEMRAAVQGITPGQQQYQSGKLNPVYITVKNVTGSDLPAFSAVKLSGETYSSRSDFVDLAIKNGVELNGDTPTSAADSIAIIQADCPAGGFVKAIVSGATPVRVTVDSSINAYSPHMYAKAAPNSYSLDVTYDVTPVRIIGNIYNSYGYAIIDSNDDRQRFIIHCTASNNYASIAKKGAVFAVYHGANGWEVQTNNNANAKRICAVCQEDIPDGFIGYYSMPFYTPEQNCGAAPAVAVSSGLTSGETVGHRGIGSGGLGQSGYEHEFSNKRLDYCYAHGQYSYCPKFTFTGVAVDRGSGTSPRVGIEIEGHVYPVTFPTTAGSGGGSLTSYPDVYAGDQITVLVEESNNANYSATVTAIKYPTDCAKGTTLVVPSDAPITLRGWTDTTTQGVTLPANLSCYTKDMGSALI